MKIAIHHRKGSFSERWIAYCEKENIEYKVVNAFDSNIVEQVKGFDVFMWHHHHAQYKDAMTAKRILFALEHAGIRVFPDFKTSWHFDDKVAQKYLFEALNVSLVPSYVFYDKNEALKWAEAVDYPKVFKLKGGAGASNVQLVDSHIQAKKLIRKAFGRGFTVFDRVSSFIDAWHLFFNKKASPIFLLKAFIRLFYVSEFAKKQPRERDYAYFQDFIPNNNSDIRVVVIGGKFAAAEKRFVRKNDFRASGSGDISYEGIDPVYIEAAFDVAKRLCLSSAAFDFVADENNAPLLVEVCYCFGTAGISKVPYYWNDNLDKIHSPFIPEELIIKEVLAKI